MPKLNALTFGQLAECVNDRVDDPASAGVGRYVGLEHLDSGSLTIRRWGVPDQVESTKLRFQPGDIIFGKRRAYQRKLAVADFEGICSAHAMVLRAKPDVVAPGFLPFFMQSDIFMKRAVEISVGSLSPTINWKTLAEQEFALPSVEEQGRIAEILESVRATIEAIDVTIACGEEVFQSALDALMSRGLSQGPSRRQGNLVYPASWRVAQLGRIAKVERGAFSHRPRNLPEFFGGPYPFVQTGDVAMSKGKLRQAGQYLSELGRTYSKAFPKSSILLTIAAVIGATAITEADGTYCPDSVVGIVPDLDIVDVRFLEYALRRARPYLEFHKATQTAQKNINLQALRPLLIALPEMIEQQEIVSRLGFIEEQNAALRARREALHSITRGVFVRINGGFS